ncbi:PREDICTED: vigilin [Cyphomyrmex costatus]|uniref:Vigilin n=1 Tax=Cyphomyrmex costatus TaxID=456900 RepID=A0A151IAB9_9HYME|nr:PREDICTED: vigilin [Cyphomyrmex costatus]XP_018402775.1 PREDICTED: vigilin [Cyphomyrmex costatus]KYM96071.1 Vigilin [Cyphomyrmex costatus]
MQQQSVIEEGMAYEPPTYDETFPVLPESSSSNSGPLNIFSISNSLQLGRITITQMFRVPGEERKFDHSDKFGERESIRTCKTIMKETNTIIEIASSKDQSLTFLITGKQNQVLEAKRRILTTFQTQASKQISIPKDHHRWILGKQGQRLKDLEQKTATKINVPGVQDQSDIITITGTKEGIEKAEHEIRVISDEQSRKAFERITVPKIYHPFIYGAHNENLNAMMAETGARINIPPASVQQDEITIAGEKEGVLAAKQKIDSIYKDMAKRCTTVSVEVPKSQHKYVIGPRGTTIAEILQTTGVSVEMPAPDSATGTITLRGPQEKLGQALNKVYEKANSVRTAVVEAPVWIHKYIIGRKGVNIKKITQEMPKVNVEFTGKEDKIKIEGPPEEVEKAQNELQLMANDLIAKLTFAELNVDPRFYKHIIGKNGCNVNRVKEGTGVVISISENDGSNIIRIEGNLAGVLKAQTELVEMVKKLENEKEKDVIIDHRYYRNIIGNKGDNIKEIRDKFNQVQIIIPGPGEKGDIVKIRGPKEDVDKCHKHLMKLVKELNESNYVLEVPIFKQFHKFVIGKGGVNIRKIREETQTKIDLPAEGEKSDVITITGKKENVEKAKEMIQKIQNELANIVTDEITIPPKFYNSLIGTGGKLIHSIMEDCGGVTIKFPTAESKSDKVCIRGPKDDVEKAKAQLLELSNEKQLSSFSAEVRAKIQHHKFLIGKNGANIKKIRESTGARIMFPTEEDQDKEVITIMGKKEAVEKAKADLEAMIKEIDNIIEGEIRIDPKHHRHFVARRGGVLHRIADECGGVQISFPRAGIDSDRVSLKGSHECIEAAKQRMREIVQELESMITVECVIPQKHHRTVMGAKGRKVQNITSECDVQIKFPDRDIYDEQKALEQVNGENREGVETIPACDIIRITGQPENVAAAKQALLDLVPITIQVDVPFDFHRSIIGQKGKDVRELMNTYDVHIMLSPAEEKLDYIKISGTPSCVQNAKEAILEKCEALKAEREDRALKSFELKLEVDPEYHPKIIGRKGAIISKIRSDHDVQIIFPRKGDSEENIISITGYEKNAFSARDDIMKIVNELNGLAKEEVQINAAVHSRLIGAKGRNIRKIMDEFKVDIKFPKKTDADPNIVTIVGAEDKVAEAKERLLNLEEEYMQDVIENEYRESLRSSRDDGSNIGGGENDTGFIVKGGPWEQQQQQPQCAPNTASVEEFPQFAGYSHVPVVTPDGPWGIKR